MDLTPAATELRHALHRLVIYRAQFDDGQRSDLRRLVQETVDEYKANAWPPEQMVIGIRHIARDAGLRSPYMVAGVASTATPGNDLLSEIVQWSLDHYFGSPLD